MSPMLPDLPVEIIALISEFSSIAAVVALSQTNRRIHSICFRYIYRVVELEDSARAVKWSTTLATNNPYAQEVRKLKLLCHISCEHSRRRFNATFHSALSNLKNLENLHLSTPHLGILPCFSDAHFPKLRICSLPLSLYTDPFVRRHPGLISLYVLPEQYHMQISSTPPDISAAEIRLPNLRTFIGPETFAFKVVPHSSASRISVMWNTRRLLLCNLSSDIATLALSRTEILTLDNIVGIWDTSLLSAIVAGLPHLLKLGFWNVSVPNSDSQNIFVSRLDVAVANLPGLTSLSVLQSPLRAPGLLNPRDLDAEFDTVRRWGSIAPTLRSAVLPSETAWARVYARDNVWYPATKSPNIPDMLIRVAWFLRRVVSSSDSDSDLGPGYARVAEDVAGKDTLSVLRAEFERLGRMPEFAIAPSVRGMSISFPVPAA
ncbi:hypothetical protein DFH08DRAFT_1088292 [Mycena albidolilacea]|uniref:F-box domain-containing protein n=1 Tax=Mycena albidolilacea TaxID=1033008 RepID=A0AAD7EB95_9AGAR|nr:hypothetical protein DFH08DRAFT_1088292 [Mycena albidolilacea]